MDIFFLDDRKYLITVDYFSNYWEIDYLKDLQSETVIGKVKSQFARHGIPECVISDNGTQFTSELFSQFSKKWNFQHKSSSPGYAQSNGKAENAVRTAKRLLKKAKADRKDPYLAILDLRNTPDQDGSSPVQKLMSRRTRNRLPTTSKLLKPKVEKGVFENIKRKKERQELQYNKSARDLKPLQVGDKVRIFRFHDKQWNLEGKVIRCLPNRSYCVKLKNGKQLRRNRKHLKKVSHDNSNFSDEDIADMDDPVIHPWPKAQTPNQQVHEPQHQQQVDHPTTETSPVKTRTGRTVKPPKYLKD
ncbi:uncharacterized protein K02A2.6-like [Anneissia japonica]|uniref:uncharacterized protein K02A2.6-like n=1 Tax=Anneissia japonica TaxID=1529436 RepID=UPI001425A29E|nr:uncharacterized protein K02A2.6-like [Anneissia japonica]